MTVPVSRKGEFLKDKKDSIESKLIWIAER